MKKFYLTLAVLPLFICIGLVIYLYGVRDLRKELESDTQIGSALWPKGSRYEMIEGDMVLELVDDHRFKTSFFPDGTVFYFSANKVKKIEPSDNFEIGEIKFPHTEKITVNHIEDIAQHQFKVTEKLHLDGIDVKKGCMLKFQKNVLMSFTCPGEKELYFKRFLELAPVEAGK